MSRWLQILAGVGATIAAAAFTALLIALAEVDDEVAMLMGFMALLSCIGGVIYVHQIVGWRHFYLGVLITLGLALLLVGGCFAFVIIVIGR